jgi:hypothetical protein
MVLSEVLAFVGVMVTKLEAPTAAKAATPMSEVNMNRRFLFITALPIIHQFSPF